MLHFPAVFFDSADVPATIAIWRQLFQLFRSRAAANIQMINQKSTTKYSNLDTCKRGYKNNIEVVTTQNVIIGI